MHFTQKYHAARVGREIEIDKCYLPDRVITLFHIWSNQIPTQSRVPIKVPFYFPPVRLSRCNLISHLISDRIYLSTIAGKWRKFRCKAEQSSPFKLSASRGTAQGARNGHQLPSTDRLSPSVINCRTIDRDLLKFYTNVLTYNVLLTTLSHAHP